MISVPELVYILNRVPQAPLISSKRMRPEALAVKKIAEARVKSESIDVYAHYVECFRQLALNVRSAT
jgi:hypothetical protein